MARCGNRWGDSAGQRLATGPAARPYRALVLPFLDYPLAMDLLSGSLQSPVARRLHDALLSGLPVLALRYHCDPASELNQLLGRNRARHTPSTCRRRSAVWAR